MGSDKNKKLLLADDSITIQKVVELVLADEGFELKLANNGEEAMEALPSFMPDIVLADLEMPVMGGYELCRNIKSAPATRSIPVILMVGAFETVDEDLIKEAGADDYIIKPFESHDLISKLRNALPAEEEAAPPAEGFSEILAEAADEGWPTGFSHDEPAEFADEQTAGKTEEEPAGKTEEELVAEEYVEEVMVPSVEESAGGMMPLSETEDMIKGEAFSERGIMPPEAEEKIPPAAAAPVAAISPEELKAAIEAQVGASVQEAIGKVDFAGIILNAAVPVMTEIAQKIAGESLPNIVESLVNQAAAAASAELKSEVERVVWETVPELAESIIKKEIESIKQGI